jgi:serine/threonine protein phosphatase PrpC
MYGHEVSGYLRENLPLSLHNNFKNKKLNINSNKSHKIIEDTFLTINMRIFNDSSVDTNFSGSTCVSLIYTPQKLVCANVGDSRAVLGRYVNGGMFNLI